MHPPLASTRRLENKEKLILGRTQWKQTFLFPEKRFHFQHGKKFCNQILCNALRVGSIQGGSSHSQLAAGASLTSKNLSPE